MVERNRNCRRTYRDKKIDLQRESERDIEIIITTRKSPGLVVKGGDSKSEGREFNHPGTGYWMDIFTLIC